MDKTFPCAMCMEALLLLLSAHQASAHHERVWQKILAAEEFTKPEEVHVRKVVVDGINEAIEGSASAFGHGKVPASPDQVKRAFGLCLLAGFIAPTLTTRKVIFGGDPRESALPEAETEVRPLSASGCHERVAYLDLWRTLCVGCVVITHGNESYHLYNTLGVQQWVLQIIVVVSGTCFARSHSTLANYCSRLMFMWSAGSSLNWLALLSTKGSWWERPFFTISFQMSFVFIPVIGALMSTPLKNQLLNDGGTARAATIWSWMCYTSMFIFSLSLWLLLPLVAPPWASDQMPRLMVESSFVMLLVAAGVHALPLRSRGLLGWAMLLGIYGFRLAHAEPRPGSEIHLIDLYNWAVFVQLCPLAGQAATGLVMARWWPLWVLACGLLIKPGMSAELAHDPPGEVLERLRFYVVEAVCVIAFTTIPSAGLGQTLPIPDSLRKHLVWLNLWALFAFCSHRAVLTLLPTWPWGTVIIFVPATAALLATASMRRTPSCRCLRGI